jgi:hypothetical protein
MAAVIVMGTGATKAQAQAEPTLAAQQEAQAQVQSIESSKLAVAQMNMQKKLDELRLARAEKEDGHAMLCLYIQTVEGVIVFVLVMLMTSAGVYMSYTQFRKGFSQFIPDKGAAPTPASPDVLTTLKITLTGVEISSSIIGLLVLAVSLAFFFLYLDRVYPIQRLDAPAPAAAKLGQ